MYEIPTVTLLSIMNIILIDILIKFFNVDFSLLTFLT